MPKRPFLVLVVVAVAAFGGQYAWQAYDEHQKAAKWEELLEGADCSACAARKASFMEKAKKRKAEAEAEQMSLIEALESEPAHDHASHTAVE